MTDDHNGEQEEVWTVSRRRAHHESFAFQLYDHNNDLVASDLDQATARRMARLPALERAAREVLAAAARPYPIEVGLQFACDRLAAALTLPKEN